MVWQKWSCTVNLKEAMLNRKMRLQHSAVGDAQYGAMGEYPTLLWGCTWELFGAPCMWHC